MKITRNKLLRLALICLIISIAVFAIAYFFFHFVTDAGITTQWQAEPGKPFVSNLIGNLALLFFFAASMCLICAFTLCEEEKK